MDLKTRRKRLRYRLKFLTKRPRLSVHKTNKYFYAQLIEQFTGKVIASYDTKRLLKDDKSALKLKPVQRVRKVGEILGKVILNKGIDKIVFDRSGYRYQGKVKAFAEGLREAGVNF